MKSHDSTLLQRSLQPSLQPGWLCIAAFTALTLGLIIGANAEDTVADATPPTAILAPGHGSGSLRRGVIQHGSPALK